MITIYPNPSINQINVSVLSNIVGSNYTIYDQIGKVVLSGTILNENTTIELGRLSVGLYQLYIGDNIKQTFKLVKK